MKTNFKLQTAGLAVLALMLTTFAGCIVEGPPPDAGYVAPVPDDYVYYPAYEVYYSSVRHQYIYRNGNAWVTRPTPPPHVAVNVLVSSPAVRMSFHDNPSVHHDAVVRTYPRNWTPPHPSAPAKKETPQNNKQDDHNKNQQTIGPGRPGLSP